MTTDKSIEFFHKCKLSFDPEYDNKYLLLHPINNIVVYRGYLDIKTKLPNGYGIQYKSKFNTNKNKKISINGTDHLIGYICRAGKWEQGSLCGEGYQYYNKNYMYKGLFLNDKPHGKGTFYKNNIIDQVGAWKNGNIYDGYGTIFYEDGSRYKGYAIDGMRSSEGILFDTLGKEVKCGKWFNDEFIENTNIQK